MRKRSTPTAGDVMSSPVVSLSKDVPLREAAQTLTEHRISGGLVVDDSNRPVGVVSLTDIASYLAGLDGPPEAASTYRYSYPATGDEDPEREWERDTNEEQVAPREIPVGEVMTPSVVSVPKNTPLPRAAERMWRQRIHRLFVSDGDGIVGVITTLDLLRALSPRRRGTVPRGRFRRPSPRP